MPLTDQQIRELRRKHFDEERLDAVFPNALTLDQWAEALNTLKQKHIDAKSYKMDSGAAWPQDSSLLVERRRKKPLQSFHPDAIETLVLNDGTGWVSEPILAHLARQFFGIQALPALKSGFIDSERIIEEFKNKILNSIKFAQTYLPPASPSPQVDLSNATTQDYLTLRKALLKSPAPKHPKRHEQAESLFELCSQILHELGSLETKSPDEAARWCHLLRGVFEAGKAHAYLERDRDPQTMAENLKGAEMVGKKAKKVRLAMENAYDAFYQKKKRGLKIGELREQLQVRRIKHQKQQHEFAFADFKISVGEFQEIYKAIHKKHRKLVEQKVG